MLYLEIIKFFEIKNKNCFRKIFYRLTLFHSHHPMIKVNQISAIHQVVLPFQIMSIINKLLSTILLVKLLFIYFKLLLFVVDYSHQIVVYKGV